MNKKILAFILLFCLVINMTIAEQEKNDPNDPSTWDFNDPVFYTQVSPVLWLQHIQSINWDLVSFSDNNLYVLDSFYENLPEENYGDIDAAKAIAAGNGDKLNPKQIQANFNEIDDLTKVDKDKAQQAVMDAFGVNVDIGKGASCKNGVFMATFGLRKSVTLSNPTYKNSILVVEDDGSITVRLSEDTKSIDIANIPEADSFTLDTNEGIIEFSDGTTLKGRLAYDKGQLYVKAGDEATINGVRIKPSRYEINIYFDGEENSESNNNYISFGEKTLMIDSTIKKDEFIFVEFEKENKYAKVEENDYLSITATNTYLELNNRDDVGLIPRVLATTNKNSRFKINSGERSLMFIYPDLNMDDFSLIKDKGSSPLSIVIENSKGKNLIGTKNEPKKIIISNYNEIATVPLFEEIYFSESDEQDPTLVSERLYFNYLDKKMYLSVKNIISRVQNIDEKEKAKIKKQLEDKWGVRPRNYFGTINSPEEADFIIWLLEASEIVSRNKFDVKLDPYELFTTFMMEGGIKLFIDKAISEMSIPDVAEVEYEGKKYEVKSDEEGKRYIEEKFMEKTTLPVPDVAEVEYEGKKYEIKTDEEGKRYIEEPQKIYNIRVPDVAEVEYEGKKYEVKSDKNDIKYIEVSKKIYNIPVPDVAEVEYEGKKYEIKTDEEGKRYIEEHQKIYNIPVPDVAEVEYEGKKYEVKKKTDYGGLRYIKTILKTYSIPISADVAEVEYEGKKYEVKSDEEGKKYISVPSEYYENHNLPVSGFWILGTDLAGSQIEQKRLKTNGFWPKDLHIAGASALSRNADFNSLNGGLIGLGGILAERKKMFLDDFKTKFGEKEYNKLSRDETTFWINVYYNYGSGAGKGELYGTKYTSRSGKIIQGSGRDSVYGKLEYEEPVGTSVNYITDFKVNSLRRLAIQNWLEHFEVFGSVPEKSIEKK